MNEEVLNAIANIIIESLKAEIQAGGHTMTGALIESIEAEIETGVIVGKIRILMNDYGLAIDQGVKPERIPYTEGSGRKTSKFIEGLKRFAQIKLGISDQRKQLSVAFAIAKAAKKKGLPIKGPAKFIDKAIAKTETAVERLLNDWVEQWVYILLDFTNQQKLIIKGD